MILKNGKRIDGCSDTVPVGALNPYIGTTPPFGYLICEGQLVSKTLYPELYAICGDTFGTSTSTQFYLPDLRGQTIAGYKQGDSDFGTLGALIGSKYLQEHQHKDITWGKNGKEYMYTGVDGSSEVFNLAGSGIFTSYYDKDGTTHIYTGNVDTDVATGNSGNIQPTMVLNWIVKAFMLMPNQSTVSTVESNSDINTYSCNYVNEINNILTSESSSGLSNITDANEHTLITKTLNKGYYLMTGSIPINYYGQSGREMRLTIYHDSTKVFEDTSVINTAAYTISKTVAFVITVVADNTPVTVRIQSSTTARYDVGWSFMQFMKLRDYNN